MLSGVLRSPRAIQVNMQIMRTFVQLCEMVSAHRDLTRRLHALERKYDVQFKAVVDAMRELMVPPKPPARCIGFHQ
jgi:hypothetical protein